MTRKGKALQLLQDVANGPSISAFDGELTETQRKAYYLWVSTWILPAIVELIPEILTAQIKVCTSEYQGKIELPGYTTK